MSVPAFIDITETDQIIELRQYFESQNIKVAAAEDAGLNENVKAIIEATTDIWKENDVKDIEGIINSIVSLMFVIPPDSVRDLIILFCDKLKLGVENGKAHVTIRSLHNLFHGFSPETPFLFDVYYALLQVGVTCRNLNSIPTDLKQIEKWLEMWKVEEEDRHKVFRLLHEAFLNCGNSDEAFKVMLKHLNGFTEENAAQAREDAIKCVVRAISDSNVFLFDRLLTLKPVQTLEGQPIFDLLNIFVSGNLKDYEEFHQNNPQFNESMNLSHEKNLHKMKLLTLVDVVNKSHEITYDDVIERLGIADEDVENFVIDAIQRKLIRGRIDQINRKVIVSQASLRTFGKSQWQQLATRLQHWKDNLQKVNDRLQTVQPQG